MSYFHYAHIKTYDVSGWFAALLFLGEIFRVDKYVLGNHAIECLNNHLLVNDLGMDIDGPQEDAHEAIPKPSSSEVHNLGYAIPANQRCRGPP